MKVLVVGSGGREHAIVWKLKSSPLIKELFCWPGNPGINQLAKAVPLESPCSYGALALWAVDRKIDLTVVGPEAPLADGIVNIFSEHGLKVFGPTREAARLESSKYFAKEIMMKAGVRTPRGYVFSDIAAAKDHVERHGAPIVVKADGLASGKGVLVAESKQEALDMLDLLMVAGRMGEGGKKVVLEEKLIGQEASLMAIVDGDTVLPLAVSRDHKRLLDGDRGPNTGGMGAISPTAVLPDDSVEKLTGEIFVPVLRELWSRGIHYTGFLYAGVMVDKSRVAHVLEFNCRLGDPETQVLLLRLQSDLLVAIDAAVNGKLSSVDLRWSKKVAACVVASSEGYPDNPITGREISGIFDSYQDAETVLFQAGTRTDEKGNLVTNGGRVLCVSALGSDLDQALQRVYNGMNRVKFEGMHFRRDIGKT